MKKQQEPILVDKYIIEFESRIFKFSIFTIGKNASYNGQFNFEAVSRFFLALLQLLQSHGYEFRKKNYHVPIKLKKLRAPGGLYFHGRKKIQIAQRYLNEPGDSLYKILIHELVHFLVFDSWVRILINSATCSEIIRPVF